MEFGPDRGPFVMTWHAIYGIHSAAVSIAVHARYQKSVVMRFASPSTACWIDFSRTPSANYGRGWAISTLGAKAVVLASISSAQRLIFARVRHPYGRRPLGNGAGEADERRRFKLCAGFSCERPYPPWRGAASGRALHALALLPVADRRRDLYRRIYGPGRREHRAARVADLGTRIRLHVGERELGRARLPARRRRVHADLRSAMPDLRQETALHHRLCGVHRGERALRLCAGSRRTDRVSVPARLRRGDAWSQQHGACRDVDGQEPARAGARRVRGGASGRDQRRPGYRRPALGDIGFG